MVERLEDLPPKVIYYLIQEELESAMEASETQRDVIRDFYARRLDMNYFSKIENGGKKASPVAENIFRRKCEKEIPNISL